MTDQTPDDGGYKWKEIGARIREARTKTGLTQKQVARLVGVSNHSVWCWEAGKMKPNSDHLLELAYLFEVSTESLFGMNVVEAELLNEADVSFRGSIAGLPLEDLEEIRDFIRFVQGATQEEEAGWLMNRAQRRAEELRRHARHSTAG